MNKEELLFNDIYNRTQDFGRTQFVREIMRLQRENKELKQKVNQLETNRDEAIEYIKEHIKYECDNAFNGMEFYSYHLYDFSNKKLLSILERGKE